MRKTNKTGKDSQFFSVFHQLLFDTSKRDCQQSAISDGLINQNPAIVSLETVPLGNAIELIWRSKTGVTRHKSFFSHFTSIARALLILLCESFSMEGYNRNVICIVWAMGGNQTCDRQVIGMTCYRIAPLSYTRTKKFTFHCTYSPIYCWE